MHQNSDGVHPARELAYHGWSCGFLDLHHGRGVVECGIQCFRSRKYSLDLLWSNEVATDDLRHQMLPIPPDGTGDCDCDCDLGLLGHRRLALEQVLYHCWNRQGGENYFYDLFLDDPVYESVVLGPQRLLGAQN